MLRSELSSSSVLRGIDSRSFPGRSRSPAFSSCVQVLVGGKMRNRVTVLVAMLLCLVSRAAAAEDAPLLAHAPTLSKTQIVFGYGGYLWSVPREGGEARQLTTGGHEGLPIFSPDGGWIAFTGQYDGNVDAFVMA